ncbi:hypothetical protein C7N43_11685 [Sphingobacteriales bacterium UPWRP_1]|nr:hypothetical protein B6N25_13445 [Sphingobacteriales bacterium TSM_CSS]PSJ76790.1 hypothetical protein C7N43_11685 [Sphingobacteriales bacterium UPWRP_1]
MHRICIKIFIARIELSKTPNILPKTSFAQISTGFAPKLTSYYFFLFCYCKFVSFAGNGNPKLSVLFLNR